MLELWKVLDKEGALTAAEARETLGRELTEAAVLRALCELWQALAHQPGVRRTQGQPARWEMLRVRHREALATGSATSQVTALSLLVSMYLQSVYAASSEEIEIFLSPVASRSRVREAVRGLSATRQIHSLSMDAQTYYFLEDGLPEFAELAAPPAETERVGPSPSRRQTAPAQRQDQRRGRRRLPGCSPAAHPGSGPGSQARAARSPAPQIGPGAGSAPRPAAAQPPPRKSRMEAAAPARSPGPACGRKPQPASEPRSCAGPGR